MSDDQRDNLVQSNRATGTTVGRYELLTKFALGGMAELFLARERGAGGLERIVVVKRLLPHLADRQESVEMFLREGRLVAQLNHPNVVQTYELGEDDGEYFLAMEYLHGSTLRELQHLADDQTGGLPLWFAISAVEQACRGLHAAHELRDLQGELVKLVHRDVSPPNLMCTDEGYVKLLDFGVAKAAEGKEATHSGHAKGKFSYMSPEQLNQDPLDRRSDIFALGIVTWELCTGERLFKREGKPRTMQAIMTEDPPPPSSVEPTVPEELDPIVLRALEKDREDRYPTVEEMRTELAGVADGHDLLCEENDLAEFVQSVASEQLEARDKTLKRTLERSLTEDERARLRHERARQRASSDASAEGRTPEGVSDTLDPTQPSGDDSSATTAPTRTDAPPDPMVPVDESEDDASGDTGFSTRTGLAVALGVIAVGVVAVLGATQFWWEPSGNGGGGSAAGAAELEGPPLSYAVAPIATRDVLRSEFSPIARYLERRIGRPVETKVPESYGATSRGVRDGTYDLAMLPPLTFVLTRRASSEIHPLVVREMDGAVSNDGLLLVRKSSEFRTLRDLRGKTFCFTDKNSTSGNFLPRVAIQQRGWTPEEFIGEVHWSGNHLQVLRDLVDGTCDAAATYSGSLLTGNNAGVPVGRLRTLAITGHIPSDTITGRPGLSADLLERIEQVHLEFRPSEHVGQKAVGDILQITGFQKPADDAYDSLVDAVKNHREILERFGMASTGPAGDGDAAP